MITREIIAELKKMYEELEAANRLSSDLIITAKEGADERMVTITRNGAEHTVPEKALWDEVYYAAETDAREILSAKYPDVFEAADKASALKGELVKYSTVHVGFNPDRMRLIDLIGIIEAVVEMKVSETNK